MYPPRIADDDGPVYRFADPEWRAKAQTNLSAFTGEVADPLRTTEYPIAGLEDDTRYILGKRVRASLFFAFGQPAGSGSSLSLRFPVSPPFRLGDRLAVEVETSLNGVRLHHAPFVAEVALQDGTPGISIQLDLPDAYANRTTDIDVRGTLIPRDDVLYHRTAPVFVPQDAYLDFAFGIEEPAWTQGPVEFRLRACTTQNCATPFEEVIDPGGIADERGWQARRIDLDGLAGREMSFAFESRVLSSSAAAFSLRAWSNPTLYAPAPTVDSRPNIILVSLDTLAATHLPTYGYPYQTAPFLDSVLAREGTVFERAVAAVTTTPQSLMSMFTSVQPCRHGVTTGMEELRRELVVLAELMRAAGYETGAVTENGWLGHQHGFGRGFNVYVENKSADVMTPSGQLDLTLKKARSWLKRNGDKRFFFFLHTFQVHEPYTPPQDYASLFRERDGQEVDAGSPRPLRSIVAYDQEIRYTDDQLRAFFEFLRERRLLDDTVIVVTSDHGEEFFEHGMQGHGRNLYDEVTRVPLLVWGRGRIPRGVRNDDTVGHVDLMPTILALANLSSPPPPKRPAEICWRRFRRKTHEGPIFALPSLGLPAPSSKTMR